MRSILLIASLFLGIVSCTDAPTARPMGFMRIGLPASDSSIVLTSGFCGFNAQVKNYVDVRYTDSLNCWVDLVYPDIKSTIQQKFTGRFAPLACLRSKEVLYPVLCISVLVLYLRIIT